MEEIPIIVSEIPPKRQSSGLSAFLKMGDRKDSGTSNSFYSSPNRSQLSQETMFTKKSFTQTRIEDWLFGTSAPSSQKSVENNELPPWASQRSQESLSPNILEEEEVDDTHSLDSLTNLIEEVEQAEVANKRQSIEYSIMANDLLFLDDDKPDDIEDRITSYTSVSNAFSPPSFLIEDENHSTTDSELYRPHDDPYNFDDQFTTTNPNELSQQSNLTGSLHIELDDSPDTLPYKSDNEDSLPDTVPYKSDDEDPILQRNCSDDLPDTMPYNSDNENDLPDTIPYISDNENDLPNTLPHHSDDENDLPDILPCQSDDETDLLDTTPFTTDKISPLPAHIPYTELFLEQGTSADDFETLSPAVSPLVDEEDLLITNEHTESPHALDLRLTTENVSTSQPSMDIEDDSDLFDIVTDEEIVQLVKKQDSESSIESVKRPASSPLLSPAESSNVGLQKKQFRSRKPSTIDDYFSLSSGYRNDLDIDEIGKESGIPSFTISSNEDIKKPDTLSQQDQRRRPRLGISKRKFK